MYTWNETADGEWNHAIFGSKAEAIAEARLLLAGDETLGIRVVSGEVVFGPPQFVVGEVVPHEPCLFADYVIEELQERAQDAAGEAADGWLDDVTVADKKALEDALQVVLRGWMKRTGNEPRFYMIENIENVFVTPAEQGADPAAE